MRTMGLKLNSYFRSVAVINNNIDKVALKAILFGFAALSILYIVFLGNMVMNIIERKSLEKEAYNLSNEVGNLQLDYLSMSSNIDYNLSKSLGFGETKATFATRKSSFGLRTDASSPKVAPNEL